MASTESVTHRPALAIESLAADDVAGALALVAEAGWNQVAADWEIFLRHGTVFKISDGEAGIVATAAILPFAPRFGWISMVLVRKSHRRRGLATELLSHCCTRLRAQDLVPLLDATPAGRTVYQPMGFQDGWSITRWRRSGAPPAPWIDAAMDAARPLRESDWPALLALDKQAFGADRAGLLRSLARRSPAFACVVERDGRLQGYLLGRNGRLATQLGPVIAANDADARALLANALERVQGEVLVDAVDGHPAFRACLPEAGFAVERSYVRMAQGTEPDAFGSATLTFSIAGPELG
jgi:ribosomal protein S18 acetylase RimI-like enzyme